MTEKIAERLFRWRSWWPLAFVPVLWIAYVLPRVAMGNFFESWWEGGCLLLAAAFWLVRVHAIGTAAPGTAGRTTRAPEAGSLNTSGLYSVVRHPLYVGNIGIATSLALFTHSVYAALFVLITTSAFFVLVGRHEERFLNETFGEEFRQWAATVPGWLPRLSAWRRPAYPFNWKRIARREFYALSTILVLAPVLDIPDEFQEHMRFVPDQIYLWLGVIGLGIFLCFRAAKKARLI